MTLKEEVHAMVQALPENSKSLVSVREKLRLDCALAEAFNDVENGGVIDADTFMEEVLKRWPARTPE